LAVIKGWGKKSPKCLIRKCIVKLKEGYKFD
jgi:hypothetical protein